MWRFAQPFLYSREVVFEPVSDQHGLSVRCFDQVFQSVQFTLVNRQYPLVFTVYRAVCHLREFAR